MTTLHSQQPSFDYFNQRPGEEAKRFSINTANHTIQRRETHPLSPDQFSEMYSSISPMSSNSSPITINSSYSSVWDEVDEVLYADPSLLSCNKYSSSPVSSLFPDTPYNFGINKPDMEQPLRFDEWMPTDWENDSNIQARNSIASMDSHSLKFEPTSPTMSSLDYLPTNSPQNTKSLYHPTSNIREQPLYPATPQSWDLCPTSTSTSNANTRGLTAAQSALIAIAMPSNRPQRHLSSPQRPIAKAISPQERRRASIPARKHSKSSSAAIPPKKAAHNMIEKRYRTNLNDKIGALRACVPSLRRGDSLVDNDSSRKLNKATILVRATEYIQQLEQERAQLVTENCALRANSGSWRGD